MISLRVPAEQLVREEGAGVGAQTRLVLHGNSHVAVFGMGTERGVLGKGAVLPYVI